MTKTKKKLATLLLSCMCIFVLSGCGNRIPEMTEEQNALITEYAAGLLLNYHADYDGRLVDTSVPPKEKPIVEIPETAISNNTVEQDDVVADAESDKPTEEPEKLSMSLAQVLGVTGFDITYQGYEICGAYPSEDTASEDLFFAMKAGAGNKLLVLKLNVANISGQEMELDIIAMTDLECNLLLNGNDRQRVYVSMLENDFMGIKKTFAADESYETVIITEMPEEKAQEITDVQLQLKNEGRETTLGIKK